MFKNLHRQNLDSSKQNIEDLAIPKVEYDFALEYGHKFLAKLIIGFY